MVRRAGSAVHGGSLALALLALGAVAGGCQRTPSVLQAHVVADGDQATLWQALHDDDGNFFHDLASRPLTEESIDALGPKKQLLRVRGLREALWKTVACALPEGEGLSYEVEGQPESFPGSLGLAPDWLVGPCDRTCQEAVTGCLFSLTNFWAAPYELYLQAPLRQGGMLPEEEGADGYTQQEGAFYGNFFTDPPLSLACTGTGFDPLSMTIRRCAQPDSPCFTTVVGPCGFYEGPTGVTHDRRVRCYDQLSLPGGESWPNGSRMYAWPVTTFLRPTRWIAPAADGQCPPGG